jgi:glycosyltransferase involved in cell wall biosynthesis
MTGPIAAVPALAGIATPTDAPTVTVSVVIPTHNFGRYIEESVASVLAQDVAGLEVIVVDDGSSDDTAERLARIRDPRLRTIRLEHVGVGAARNHGLSVARGRYLAFLDADDRWRPSKLRRQLLLLDNEPTVGFVFTNFVRFDEQGFHGETQFDLVPVLSSAPTRPSAEGDGHVIVDDTFCTLAPLPQLPCWTQTLVVRADLVRGVQFPADMKLSQDLYYVLCVYDVANGAYIDEPLVEVRRHAGNSYRRADQKVLPDIDALTRVLAVVTQPRRRTALRRRLGRAWLAAGYHYFWSGRGLLAARAYLRALTYPGARKAGSLKLLAVPFAPLAAALRPQERVPFGSGRP